MFEIELQAAGETIDMAIQIAEELETVYIKEIIHRDIKSQYIVTNDSKVKILDIKLYN